MAVPPCSGGATACSLSLHGDPVDSELAVTAALASPQWLRRRGPQARVMAPPGGTAAHASAAASRAAVHTVGRPSRQATHVSLTRCSARWRPGRFAAIAAFPAAWRRFRMDRKVPPASTVPKSPSAIASSRSMTKVTMSCGRCRGSDPRCEPTIRDLPFLATQGGKSRRCAAF